MDNTSSALYFQLAHRLRARYDEGEARAIARLLLHTRYGLTLAQLCSGTGRPLTMGEASELESLTQRLEQGEPVQYVLGEALFFGRTYEVTPSVLIPRPETEDLVAAVLREYAASECLRLLDMGTGSGCIAISLALELPQAKVWGLDLSPAALDVARRNALRLQAEVTWAEGDMQQLSAWPDGPFDIVVSNPPYVLQREREAMEAHVRDHEPALALFVPDDDPLRFYRALAQGAARRLKAGGRMFMEVNGAFARATAELFVKEGFTEVGVLTDRFGKERFVVCQKKGPYQP